MTERDPSVADRGAHLSVAALGMAVLLVVPGVPILGAILGGVALALGVHGANRKMAWAAVYIGGIGGMTSLLALWTVVAPGALNVGSRARQKDVEFSLRSAERGLYKRLTTHGGFPVGDTGWTPETPCCAGAGQVCPLNPEDWEDPIWRAIGFQPLTDTTFQLRYQSDSDRRFEVRARGDVDCDGHFTEVVMRGGVNSTGGPFTEAWTRIPEL
jgi:hypothetical protein